MALLHCCPGRRGPWGGAVRAKWATPNVHAWSPDSLRSNAWVGAAARSWVVNGAPVPSVAAACA
jgi:hypothetical protein